MDFQAGITDSTSTHQRDSIWAEKIDTICYELNQIFPSRSAAEFKSHLLEGKRKVMKNGTVGARHWAIWPRRVDYNTFCEIRKLPIFKEPSIKAVSTGRNTMLVVVRSAHWLSVPWVICLAQRTVPNMVWSYRTTPS